MKTKKNRFNNILKFGVFLFGISLLLWNCEKETLENEYQNQISLEQSIEKYFELNKTSVVNSLKNKINRPSRLKKGKGFTKKYGNLKFKKSFRLKIITSSDSTNFVVTPLIKKAKNNNQNSILISYIKEGILEHKIFKQKDYSKKNVSKTEFSILTNLDFIYSKTFENLLSRGAGGWDCEWRDACTQACTRDNPFTGGFEIYFIYHCEEAGDFDFDNNSDDGYVDANPDADNDTEEEEDWEYGGGGSEESSNIDYFSVDFLTNECAKKVIITELLSGVDASFINEVFSLFNNANIHLDIRNTNLPVNQNAATSTPTNSQVISGSFTINIGINNSYLNNNPTKLSIAAITIHELNHAQLTYYWAKGTLLTQHPSYTTLNTALTNYSLNPSSSNRDAVNDQMHIAMVDSIENMAESLFEYSDNTNTNTTLDYCKKLITGTLYGTAAANIINANHSNNSNYLNECNNINVNEQNNNSQSQGNDC